MPEYVVNVDIFIDASSEKQARQVLAKIEKALVSLPHNIAVQVDTLEET